jgi:ACS family D-galactonate transporter-like MFS transporter
MTGLVGVSPRAAAASSSADLLGLRSPDGAARGLRSTGYIVGATQSFTGAFLVAGIVLVIGIVAYVFILGRLEPIADPSGA